MTSLAKSERAALAALFESVGPDAPTLCGGWATRDLAAHLILRERTLLASGGIVFAPLSGHTQRVQDSLAADPWDGLVDKVRAGAPWWTVMGHDPVDRMANGLEYLIHHEDVRRATDGWTVRELPAEHEHFIWSMLSKRGKHFFRKAPTGVVLRTLDGRDCVARDEEPRVVVVGKPSELALYAYGRQHVADVTLEGGPDDVEALRTASLGV